MSSGLRSKAKDIEAISNMPKSGNRYDLLEPTEVSTVETNRTAGLDNRGVVQLQRQIMREQDEDLDKLQESILNTKHIALAVNEELDLHAKLIDSFDQDVDDTESQLQRVQKRLGILNKRMNGGCSCKGLLMSVTAIVVLVVISWNLIKYL